MTTGNEDQIAYWNRQGNTWVEWQQRLDAQIAPHGELALEVLAPERRERILDVGCGCGDTVLALAERVGPEGSVVGVDVSEPMLACARERVTAAGLLHVELHHGDAAAIDLPGSRFDALFSRLGVMFFSDPAGAFRHLRGLLRPDGRLAFVCWRGREHNPWITVPGMAIAQAAVVPPPPPAPPDSPDSPDSPGMLSLADEGRVRQVLESAGFVDVTIRAEEVLMSPGGGDLEDATDLFLEVGPVAGALREAEADEATRARAREVVRKAFEAHLEDGTLLLGSGCWVVSAARG